MSVVARYDRFLVLNKIGTVRVLRRFFTPEERWCWVAGILGTAADSPIRGWLLITEKMPADVEDYAEAAGVNTATADSTLQKALKFSMVEHDDEAGCLWVPDWEKYNPPVPRDATGARRQALFRDPELREQIRERDGDSCRYCGVEVNWTDRRGQLGGTYDHVDPFGPNTLENLVVACRACNSAKGQRIPSDAEMVILPPNGANGVTPDLSPGSKSGVTQGSKEGSKEERKKGTSTANAVEDVRDDVRGLCDLLADEVERNGSKRPAVTKAWTTSCRLLIDRDGRTYEQIEAAIHWCQADEFWRANVLSMPTLRRQFDKMRLQAERQRPALRAVGSSAEERRTQRQMARMEIARGEDVA